MAGERPDAGGRERSGNGLRRRKGRTAGCTRDRLENAGIALGTLLALSAASLRAEGERADGVRSAWRYRRSVKVTPSDEVLAAVTGRDG